MSDIKFISLMSAAVNKGLRRNVKKQSNNLQANSYHNLKKKIINWRSKRTLSLTFNYLVEFIYKTLKCQSNLYDSSLNNRMRFIGL